MSVQYNRALAEKLTIEGVIRELQFKRSHLLTQATNAKMEIDSYERRLAEVKLTVDRYKPSNPDLMEPPPRQWPVTKSRGPSIDRSQMPKRPEEEIEDIPLQSPPRIPRKLLTYREFMRKYHNWSPGTELEKLDDIEEFSDDETKLFDVVKKQLQKTNETSTTKAEVWPLIPGGVLPKGTRPLDLITIGSDGITRLVDAHKQKSEAKKDVKPTPSPLVRRTGGKGPMRRAIVVEDSEDEKPKEEEKPVEEQKPKEEDYDSDKTDRIFPEEGGWIGVASETFKEGDYVPPRPKTTPKRPLEEPLEAPGAPKKTKGPRWLCGNFCDDCKQNFVCHFSKDMLDDVLLPKVFNSPK